MTARELDQLWDRLSAVEKKIDRLFWIILLAVAALGGPGAVQQLLKAVS